MLALHHHLLRATLAIVAGGSLPGNTPAATINVNTTADTIVVDGFCSLREAIGNANNNTASSPIPGECAPGAGADVIVLPAGTYSISRAGNNDDTNVGGDFDILGPLTITGSGRDSTTISGNFADRVFDVRIASGQTVAVQDLSIIGGLAPTFSDGATGGGGIRMTGAGRLDLRRSALSFNGAGSGTGAPNGRPGNGGALYLVAGAGAVIEDCSFAFNRAGSVAANADNDIRGGQGGAIWQVGGSTTIRRTLFDRNSAGDGNAAGRLGGDGGSIQGFNSARFDIAASSFVGNETGVGGNGGAIASYFGGGVSLYNVTLSGNRAGGYGGALVASGVGTRLNLVTVVGNIATQGGGGLAAFDSFDILDLHNSIVATNSAPPGSGDCSIDTFAQLRSNGFNVLGIDSGCQQLPTTDLHVADPRLSALTTEGGTLPVHRPLANSAALDAGNCGGDDRSDQVGALRPQDLPDIVNLGNGCDSGAIEVLGDSIFANQFEQ